MRRQVSSRLLLLVGTLLTAACSRDAIPEGVRLYAQFNQRKPIAVMTVSRAGDARIVESLMKGRMALQSRVSSAANGPKIECIVGGGQRVLIQQPPAPGDVVTLVPLDDPGRAMYREWAWLRRPRGIVEIDSELARLAGLSDCAVLQDGIED